MDRTVGLSTPTAAPVLTAPPAPATVPISTPTTDANPTIEDADVDEEEEDGVVVVAMVEGASVEMMVVAAVAITALEGAVPLEMPTPPLPLSSRDAWVVLAMTGRSFSLT